MATCTLEGLISEESAKFTNLTKQQRRALMVYMLIQELAALGGTDYSADFLQLQEDVKPFSAMREDQREGALIQIFKENAVAAGATIPDDINDLMEAIKCIECARPSDLELILLLLTCQLGVHA
ncbi:MAG TPA: hypothetical protein VFU31_20990 [Candidatus Binatia bacterium]|nr:hypothetical protein [Candidatus Binatia bacterium]